MYFVTGVTEDGKVRCFGYYESIGAIDSNLYVGKFNDLQECLYAHLVVENIPEGVYRSPVEERWYEWIGEWDLGGDRGRWQECEKPKRFKGVVNFAIG